MANYPVSAGADDWYDKLVDGVGNTKYEGTTTLYAGWNRTITPWSRDDASADIDTSAIGTDTISAATLNIYLHSYAASKGTSQTYYVRIGSGSSYQVVHSGTFSAGWLSINLASYLANINKTGVTRVLVSTDDPGNVKFRALQVRAYEYGSSNQIYFDITHAPAASGATLRLLSLTGVGK
jgi:hypothetical protein